MADREGKLDVEVLTPEGEVFRGEVTQLSTRTALGEIGILADHVPVLAALKPTELRLARGSEETLRYAQAHGWLEVFANHARVLIEEARSLDELDAADLKEQLSECEQRIGEASEDSAAYERAVKDRERIETFLSLAERQ